ncbi:unnamed protein product [Gongylonema pulchrum]|uniref:Venom protein n=1 Tax=Gongylonema pulchrum TaxID=637853 RepID=A0A183CX19_9BILA|nr:unnamed protein product [Gongylonema pulchrum]
MLKLANIGTCAFLLLAVFLVCQSEQSANASGFFSECEGRWLEWSDWTKCSDECGACGKAMRVRSCLSPYQHCSCKGLVFALSVCNMEVCRHPRPPCCHPHKVVTLFGTFVCF